MRDIHAIRAFPCIIKPCMRWVIESIALTSSSSSPPFKPQLRLEHGIRASILSTNWHIIIDGASGSTKPTFVPLSSSSCYPCQRDPTAGLSRSNHLADHHLIWSPQRPSPPIDTSSSWTPVDNHTFVHEHQNTYESPIRIVCIIVLLYLCPLQPPHHLFIVVDLFFLSSLSNRSWILPMILSTLNSRLKLIQMAFSSVEIITLLKKRRQQVRTARKKKKKKKNDMVMFTIY